MEPLFRLTLRRPAIAQDPENPSIVLSSGTALQNALIGLGTGDIRDQAVQLALAFAQSQDFIAKPQSNPFAGPLSDLAKLFDAAELAQQLTAANLHDAVNQAFGKTPPNVVADPAFGKVWSQLADSLLAIKVLKQEHRRPIEDLARQLRDMEVIKKLANNEKLTASGALHRSRRRSIQLPTALRIAPELSTGKIRDKLKKKLAETLKEKQGEVDDLVAHYNRLREALNELGKLRAGHFHEAVSNPHPGFTPPAELDGTRIATNEAAFLNDFRALNLKGLAKSIDAFGHAPGNTGHTFVASEPVREPSILALAAAVGSPKFQPPDGRETGFVLSDDGVGTLSAATKDLAKNFGFDLAKSSVDEFATQIEGALAEAGSALDTKAGTKSNYSYKKIGNAVVSMETPVASAWNYIGVGAFIPWIPIPFDGTVPHTKGDVKPAGIADLLLVRQQLVRYEAADVAHIENVLKGEAKLREHTRRSETQIVTLSETEISTSEERELESTDRYEMTKEASKTLKEDAQLKAGLKVSGKYGPAVEFSASAEGSLQRTKTEATKTASKFSQDVTERSSRKIAERALERITRTTTTETIEKNTHELNNQNGGGHISGVYQWVNKVYEAQMYNYGLRAMFDFMVPEPAAFLIQMLRKGHAEAISLTKPPKFDLKPENISESNYGYWIKVFGATDVSAPPSLFRTVAADFHAGGGDDKTNYNHSGQITIDEGYKAVYGSVGAVWNQWANSAALDIVLGRKAHRMAAAGSWVWTANLNDEEGTIPLALNSFKVSQIAVAVEVKCRRTDRAMRKWQLETHAKLRQAHMALVADYEEKLAQLELQAGVVIEGRNPATNLNLIEDELKKNCISILTDQHFDLFDAIETAPGYGYEEINIDEAAGEGRYVRFFEQAFEWENISWVNYPYFWGRKSQWDERMTYDDPDPVFNEFLRAGYCRVSVPARPGFEGAIDHFLTFGEPWSGGPLPTISSDLYLPIADEIAERLDRPGDEVPQGDPWLVRIPTSLVKLRDDDKLPKWAKDQNGDWVEV